MDAAKLEEAPPRPLQRRINTADLQYFIGEKPPLVQTRLLLLLQTLVVILQVVVVFKDFWINRNGSLSSKMRTLYTVGTAILASSLSMMSFNFVKSWWLHSLHRSDRPLVDRQRMIHLALGLGSFSDWFRFWPMSIAFLTLTLYTAAIVTSLAPFQANSAIGISSPLLHTARGICLDRSNTEPETRWRWREANGTWISYTSEDHAQFECQYGIFDTLQHYLTMDVTPKGVPAYSIGQLEVFPSAIGAPIDHSQNVPNAFTAMGLEWSSPAFVSTSACLPVFETNPVRCERTRQFKFSNNTEGSVDGCKLSWDGNHLRGPRGRLGVDVCTSAVKYEPGKVKVVWGSTADFSVKMSAYLNTDDFPKVRQSESETIETALRDPYAIACTIDIAKHVVFKQVTLSKIPGTVSQTRSIVQYQLTAKEGCTPRSNGTAVKMKDVLTDDILAYASAGLDDTFRSALGSPNDFTLFMDTFSGFNYNLSTRAEWSRTIMPGSRSRLEDFLGLVTAIVLGANIGASAGHDSIPIDGAAIYAFGTRVGVGQPWALIYTLPVLLSILLVSLFHWRYGSL